MTDERFHDTRIRADLAFEDCRHALAELTILLPHLDVEYLAALLAEADELHEAVTRFAESVKTETRVEVVDVPTRRLHVV